MLVIDTVAGRIIDNDEIKHKIATEQPYRKWLDENLIKLNAIKLTTELPKPDPKTLLRRQLAFGYTLEDLTKFLKPMATKGIDPLGAMGNDAPLAVLSEEPQLLYNYFKQLFAQVTNPPIDALLFGSCLSLIFTSVGIPRPLSTTVMDSSRLMVTLM